MVSSEGSNSVQRFGVSKPKTRHQSSCKLTEFIGPGKEFALAAVPTNRAVIQKGLLLREDKLAKEGIDAKNYSVKEIYSDLAPLVEAQWTDQT